MFIDLVRHRKNLERHGRDMLISMNEKAVIASVAKQSVFLAMRLLRHNAKRVVPRNDRKQ